MVSLLKESLIPIASQWRARISFTEQTLALPYKGEMDLKGGLGGYWIILSGLNRSSEACDWSTSVLLGWTPSIGCDRPHTVTHINCSGNAYYG